MTSSSPNPLPDQGPRRLPHRGALPARDRLPKRVEAPQRHPVPIGSCADPETRMPVLFMELMDESLTSFLERPADPPPLPLHVQVDIGHDVAQALSHLHRHEVLHRDLSSNNVLLIGSRRAKVTDFGMADPPTYTSKLDIFSCGVLFVQLITRK